MSTDSTELPRFTFNYDNSVGQSNFDRFCAVYTEKLEYYRQTKPDEYQWPISELNVVAARMTAAFRNGGFNKDSEAIKATCKHFKIKHTYKAIREFIGT